MKLVPKYGLQSKQSKPASQVLKKPRPAIFGDDALEGDDDDGSSENTKEAGDKFRKQEIQRVNKHLMDIGSRIGKDTAKVYEDALSTDASVFDYDGAYDSFKAQQTNAATSQAPAAAPVCEAFDVISCVVLHLMWCYFQLLSCRNQNTLPIFKPSQKCAKLNMTDYLSGDC